MLHRRPALMFRRQISREVYFVFRVGYCLAHRGGIMTADTDTAKKHSEWLLMVYAAGDNNLSANSIALMQDLEAANHREEVRVLAAFDSATPIPQGARY